MDQPERLPHLHVVRKEWDVPTLLRRQAALSRQLHHAARRRESREDWVGIRAFCMDAAGRSPIVEARFCGALVATVAVVKMSLYLAAVVSISASCAPVPDAPAISTTNVEYVRNEFSSTDACPPDLVSVTPDAREPFVEQEAPKEIARDVRRHAIWTRTQAESDRDARASFYVAQGCHERARFRCEDFVSHGRHIPLKYTVTAHCSAVSRK
jgi:hypothetical protein